MTRLVWGETGSSLFETGVDRGVFYPTEGPIVPWNGLTSVKEVAEDGDIKSYYFDGVLYVNHFENTDFVVAVQALSVPVGFEACEGLVRIHPAVIATKQPRSSFNFAYRTLVGNDVEDIDYGYKVTVVYNATAIPTARTHNTISTRETVMDLEWNIRARPDPSVLGKPEAYISFSSLEYDAEIMGYLEDKLYGSVDSDPVLLTRDEILDVLTNGVP
jgi:hypothetical protein